MPERQRLTTLRKLVDRVSNTQVNDNRRAAHPQDPVGTYVIL